MSDDFLIGIPAFHSVLKNLLTTLKPEYLCKIYI